MAGPTTRKAARIARLWIRRGQTDRPLPSFLLIGAQRCGTTSLYRYLLEHPDVHPALVKEIQFFTFNYTKGESWYRSHFPVLPAGGLTFDASPYYLYHPQAAGRASALVPDARLIALLRNPVERAFSHYQHNVQLGTEKLSFEEALEAEPARLAGEEELIARDPAYPATAHRRYSYVARGEYATQLERWLARYPKQQMQVVVSEEFFDNPGRVFARLLEYLGLLPLELTDYPAYTRSSGPAVTPISAHTRSRLEEHFAPGNRRLANLLGRALPWPG